MSCRPPSDRQLHADPAGTIRAEACDHSVVLTIAGVLDGDAGRALLAALEAALELNPERIDVDLVGVDDFTPDGLEALNSCRSYAFQLEEGLHYRTVPGPGQEAFLAAFQ